MQSKCGFEKYSKGLCKAACVICLLTNGAAGSLTRDGMKNFKKIMHTADNLQMPKVIPIISNIVLK